MATSNHTVISLKSAFLRTQTRILSQPLQVPDRWRDRDTDAAEIPESAIKDVLREVNRLLRRHTKSAYPSLAVRHVAEQIDALYWAAGAPELYLPPPDSSSLALLDTSTGTAATPTDPLLPTTDFTTDAAIAALPDTWAEAAEDDSAADVDADADAAAAYEERVQRLRELAERRRAAEAKLARYRKLRDLLDPLREPRESVQPNLVTRDAELAKEVAAAKTLGVRVAARVGTWAEGREEVLVEGAEQESKRVERGRREEREKLGALLRE